MQPAPSSKSYFHLPEVNFFLETIALPMSLLEDVSVCELVANGCPGRVPIHQEIGCTPSGQAWKNSQRLLKLSKGKWRGEATDKQEENAPSHSGVGYGIDPKGAVHGGVVGKGRMPPAGCSELGNQIGQITVVPQCHK